MVEIELCGHIGCDKHLQRYDINYKVRQTVAYKARRGAVPVGYPSALAAGRAFGAADMCSVRAQMASIQ